MIPPSSNEGSGGKQHEISARFSQYLIQKVAAVDIESDTEVSALELDSHADSPVVGKHAKIIRHTGQEVKVSGFTDELGDALPVEIVDAAVIYDCEFTGSSYIMVISNALYLRAMNVSLIPPFMMRMAGIEVNERPKFLAKAPTIKHHSMYFPEEDKRFPSKLHGMILYILVHMPSNDEIVSIETVLELTPKVNKWDPHNDYYEQQEESMLTSSGELKERQQRKFIVSTMSCKSKCTAIDAESKSSDYGSFCNCVTQRTSKMGLSTHKVYSIKTASGAKLLISPKDLAQTWNIGLETARKTLKVTTHLVPQNVHDITLNRRYAANDLMIRYQHI